MPDQHLAQNCSDLKDADFHYHSLCAFLPSPFSDTNPRPALLTLLCRSLPLVLSTFKAAGVLEEMLTTEMANQASKEKPAAMFKDAQLW